MVPSRTAYCRKSALRNFVSHLPVGLPLRYRFIRLGRGHGLPLLTWDQGEHIGLEQQSVDMAAIDINCHFRIILDRHTADFGRHT